MESEIKRKIPPQALDFEELVLGAMMQDSDGLETAINIITQDAFYHPKHQLIFSAITRLYENRNPVNIITVDDELKKLNKTKNLIDVTHLISLTQKVASAADIEYNCYIILQMYIKRESIYMATLLIEESYNESSDTFDIIKKCYDMLDKTMQSAVKKEPVELKQILKEVITKAINIHKGEVSSGIRTPIESLNRTLEFRKGELIIIAARPGFGKSSLALLCALNAAKEKLPVAYFSLEMSKETLVSRLLSMECKIIGQNLITNGINEEETKKALNQGDILNKIPLYIADDSSLSILDFQIKARKLKSKRDIKLIVIDYLQLMSSSSNRQNREQEISKISRGLKTTSLELDIPIIVLSQLSRAVETRGGDKVPQLSDLRDSGAIEQDADVVIFLYNPNKYDITHWGEEYNHESTEGQMEYIVRKNRNGTLARGRMEFEGKYTLFSDLKTQKNASKIDFKDDDKAIDNKHLSSYNNLQEDSPF